MNTASIPSSLVVVVIGRNEGERLRSCLVSVHGANCAQAVVYVDSGSTDDSVALARGLGSAVVNLDMGIAFTAARARNEGLAAALALCPEAEYVQFVDGDCEVVSSWLPAAVNYLNQHPEVVAVCGRRRERFPQRSVYNRLCDLEWATKAGQSRSCGGDAMMRTAPLVLVGGYRSTMIAGEEPELCVRLRAKGWKIWRLDEEMTLHDAAMFRFGQWWNRAKRAGHAFAEGAALHGAYPERHNVRETLSAVLWAWGMPACIALLSLLSPYFLLLLLVYPVQVIRLALGSGLSGALAWWRAFYLVLGKFAESAGIFKYGFNRLRSKQGTLIEYK